MNVQDEEMGFTDTLCRVLEIGPVESVQVERLMRESGMQLDAIPGTMFREMAWMALDEIRSR